MDQIIQQYFDFTVMFDGGNFDKILRGFGYTMLLFAIAGTLSMAWGLFLSLVRQVPGKALAPLRWLTISYIDVLRSVPMLLVLLIVFGSLGALYSDGLMPEWLGIPRWFGLPDPFWYGAMAITLTYGAYMAEVYRAGIEAVPHGQMEAARSLGMSHGHAMRYVIVPQAVRKVIPPLLNDLIALMKDTSLVSVIGLIEVVQVGRDIQAETYNSSALMLGAILFLIVTIPIARIVDHLIVRERRRTSRGSTVVTESSLSTEPPSGLPTGGV